MEVGKYSIPTNVCTQAHREGIVVFSGVASLSFDTAVNLCTAFQGVCKEGAKAIFLAFHGYAVSAVSFYHRRCNFHARLFLDNTACSDNERIVRSFQFTLFFIPDSRLRAGRNVAADGYVPTDRRKTHVISCRKFETSPHTSV